MQCWCASYSRNHILETSARSDVRRLDFSGVLVIHTVDPTYIRQIAVPITPENDNLNDFVIYTTGHVGGAIGYKELHKFH
jgi:hypothetical protein